MGASTSETPVESIRTGEPLPCASNVPVVNVSAANVSDGDVVEAVAEGALVAPRVPRVIVVDVSAARVSVGEAFAEWRRINMQKSERVKKGVPESFVSTDGRLAIVVLAKDGSTREGAIDVTNSSEDNLGSKLVR
jgi:hypothetical protein